MYRRFVDGSTTGNWPAMEAGEQAGRGLGRALRFPLRASDGFSGTERKGPRQIVSYVLAMLLVIVGSLLYVVRKQQDRAERNLALAKKAVDESLSSAGREQGREAADLPQMEEFRKELLDKARIFYLAFVTQYPLNESLRKEAALAHSKLGDIDRLVENHEAAIAEYKQAIAQFEDLARQHPRNLRSEEHTSE